MDSSRCTCTDVHVNIYITFSLNYSIPCSSSPYLAHLRGHLGCNGCWFKWMLYCVFLQRDHRPLYSLQASNCVMDLDHVDGRLKIQYSDRLVSLLREVRQLSALGFPIPAKIQQAANTADKFYRQANVLKQVRVRTFFPPLFIYFWYSLS